MPKPDLLSEEELAFLRELVRRKVDFMIVGLAAAALQGAPVVTQDVDLWFCDLSDPNIRKALKKVGGAFVASVGLTPPTFAGEAVRLFDIVTHMHGLDCFEEEVRNTVRMQLDGVEVPVLRLERIIKSKRATGRAKDKLALLVLEDSLRTLKAQSNELLKRGKKKST